MKEILKPKVLDSKKVGLYDKESGEPIYQDFKGTLSIMEQTNLVKLSYSNYVYLDSDKVNYFSKLGLKLHHLGLISILSSTIKYNNNACVDETGEPLSTKQIGLLIGRTVNATKALINDLESCGLIWYGKFREYKGKVYVLNPYFVRKGTKFSKLIVSKFFEHGIDPSKDKAEGLRKIMEKGESRPKKGKDSLEN
jgi:hypothetical protein